MVFVFKNNIFSLCVNHKSLKYNEIRRGRECIMCNIIKIFFLILLNIVWFFGMHAAIAPYKTSQSISIPLKNTRSILNEFSYYSCEDFFEISGKLSISPSLIQLFFNSINQNDQYKLMEYIKKYPLLLASCDQHGNSALIKIFEHFDFLTVRYIVGQGIGLNMHDDVNQTTPLIYAIQRGDIILVRLLLEQESINIFLEDRWKRTALHYAVLLGDFTIVQLLLKRSPDIFKKDWFEKSALDYAQEHHLQDIEAVLVQSLLV